MWQKSCRNKLKKRTLKQLRLVKFKKHNENLWPDSCPVGVEKPYSLVRPIVVQARRPVMLSPGCLAPLLLRNLLGLPSSSQDFCFSPADNLANQRGFCASSKNVVNAERLSQTQRDCGMIHMIQEAIKKNQHCLLELEVQLVKDLIKSEIYPIIIHIKVTEKKIKGVRSLLEKPGQRESEVLKKCQRDEWLLHTLPCSWVWIDPQSWSSAEDLVKVVRAHIFQEQTRMVWVEENDM